MPFMATASCALSGYSACLWCWRCVMRQLCLDALSGLPTACRREVRSES